MKRKFDQKKGKPPGNSRVSSKQVDVISNRWKDIEINGITVPVAADTGADISLLNMQPIRRIDLQAQVKWSEMVCKAYNDTD